MKSKYIHPFVSIDPRCVVMACSATTPDDDKQSRLQKLKEEQASLSKEIKKLEDEIAKANPDSVKVRAKEIAVIDLAPRSFDYSIQTQGAWKQKIILC